MNLTVERSRIDVDIRPYAFDLSCVFQDPTPFLQHDEGIFGVRTTNSSATLLS